MMQTLQLKIEDNLIDKIMWLLGNFQGVKIENITNCNIEDINLFEEAKKDRDGIKTIDEVLKNI
jgi:hypothetical protein